MKNILNDINNINSKENNINDYIICEYDIKKEKLNQLIQILNSYEELKKKDWEKNAKGIENEKEIKENCEEKDDKNEKKVKKIIENIKKEDIGKWELR